MNIKSILLVAGLVCGTTSAAHADWQNTHWGMSPAETLAALEGARSHDPSPDEIYEHAGQSYAPRVKLPVDIEGVGGEASMLFDSAERLHFVLFNPDDADDCETLATALSARHGPAETLGAGSIAISDWSGDGNAIKLTSVQSAGICNLSYSAP